MSYEVTDDSSLLSLTFAVWQKWKHKERETKKKHQQKQTNDILKEPELSRSFTYVSAKCYSVCNFESLLHAVQFYIFCLMYMCVCAVSTIGLKIKVKITNNIKLQKTGFYCCVDADRKCLTNNEAHKNCLYFSKQQVLRTKQLSWKLFGKLNFSRTFIF